MDNQNVFLILSSPNLTWKDLMDSGNKELLSSPTTETFTSSSARFKTCRKISWGPGWGGAISLGQRTHVRITNNQPCEYKENRYLSPISEASWVQLSQDSFLPLKTIWLRKLWSQSGGGNTSSMQQAQISGNKLHTFWLSCRLIYNSPIVAVQSAKGYLC